MAAVQLRLGGDLERNYADPNIPLQSPHRDRQTRGRSEDPRVFPAGLSCWVWSLRFLRARPRKGVCFECLAQGAELSRLWCFGGGAWR